jgi:hypothetical protein
MTQCLQRQHAVYDVNLQGAKHELRLHWLLVAVTHKQDQALHPYSAAASAPDCIASRVKAGPRRLDAWQREGRDRGRGAREWIKYSQAAKCTNAAVADRVSAVGAGTTGKWVPGPC